NNIKENRKSEIIYQVYPSSFKDSNGDGIGDLKGITEELGYIKNLHVDAIWISPFFKTPEGAKGDGGYAVSDYREIDPKFGSMKDFENLLAKAHEKGLRVYTDFVMCHTSDEHEWFEKSRKKEKGFEDRFVWVDGKKNENGDLILVDGKPLPPNNWKSVFKDEHGGSKSAWSFDGKIGEDGKLVEGSGRGQFYLHHFNDSQPALNANNDEVQKSVIKEMEFWMKKGVDGLRLDALPFANYDPQLRDNPGGYNWNEQKFEHSMCQPQTVEYVKKIREMLDSYPETVTGIGGRRALGEAIAGRDGGGNAMPVAKEYVDEKNGLHTVYTEPKFWPDHNNGKHSGYPSAGELKAHLKDIEENFPGGSMCNYLSNHDFSRASTRMMPENIKEEKRATVLKQLMAINFALPGSVCMYQGEELGLPNAKIETSNPNEPYDIPRNKIQDKLDTDNCRDVARAPMPWNSNLDNAGFSSAAAPYLPMPKGYEAMAVNEQEKYNTSMLNVTRLLIKDRQNNPALQSGTINILDTKDKDADIFAFTRQSDATIDKKTGEKIPAQTLLFAANMSPHTKTIKPSDYLDKKTLANLHLQDESSIIIGGYGFSRRGFKGLETESQFSAASLANGHSGKKIFAVDLLIADIFHPHNDKIAEISKDKNWELTHRESIDKETHEQLLAAPNNNQQITIGGSTLITLDTLKKLQPKDAINVDFLGVTGNDKLGDMVKTHLKTSGINLPTSNHLDGITGETAVSHIIKTAAHDHDMVITYPGNEADMLREIINKNPKLLEESIAKSDIVYLSGSIIEKFGKTLVDDILTYRGNHEKEMVLSLPIHSTLGPDDTQTFRGLINSANIIVGNDKEYCRIYDIKADHPATEEQMKIVTNNIQKSFKEEVLQNELGMPFSKQGQVAFITRGNKPALLVTKDKVEEIPVAKIGKSGNLLGAGDAATAAFLDAELRGLTHQQSAKFAMAIGAEKVQQVNEDPRLDNVDRARKNVFLRNDMKDIAAAYHANKSLGKKANPHPMINAGLNAGLNR
ncbi:MAG: PfkB family carbohydrate kinase, partial [Rickettsiales bacterium]